MVHLRNAVLGSRNAKEFGIDGEIMQCSIAIKSANGALKWENESNLSSRGGYLFEIGGCAWKALQEHHSIIGKSLDKPKKLKSMSKRDSKLNSWNSKGKMECVSVPECAWQDWNDNGVKNEFSSKMTKL